MKCAICESQMEKTSERKRVWSIWNCVKCGDEFIPAGQRSRKNKKFYRVIANEIISVMRCYGK